MEMEMKMEMKCCCLEQNQQTNNVARMTPVCSLSWSRVNRFQEFQGRLAFGDWRLRIKREAAANRHRWSVQIRYGSEGSLASLASLGVRRGRLPLIYRLRPDFP